MNDSPNNKNPKNQPRKTLIGLLLPYILVAVVVIFFVSLLLNNFNSSGAQWTESQLDGYLGYNDYSLIATEGIQYKTPTYEIDSIEVSNGYKCVTVQGKYVDKTKKTKSTFSVVVQESTWNNEFAFSVSVDNLTYDVTHKSYSDIFKYRIDNSTLGGTMTVVDAFQASWWDNWGPTIITTGITILLMFFVLTRLVGSVNGANKSAMDFNKSPARREDTSKIRFNDVAGCDEEKAEMVELVEYLKDPKKYSKFGARLPKGVLLIGPPGTGKTLLAKAVAGEAHCPFYSISGSDFVEMFVGVGAGRVRDLFKQAKQTAPCLIFIDEIDAVGRQRGAGLGGGNDEREQTLNQLLVEMDGFSANSGILVIAATNRDDVLDPALRRAGRFDRTITVNLPDKSGREAIFKVHARNKTISKDVDFGNLAKRTVGFSGADIENILNEAAILAVRANKTEVDMKDIDEAIDRRIAGPAKSSKGMNEKERTQVAYHEAGHAVIGLNLKDSDKVQKITIIPRGRTGGHVLMTPEDDRYLLTKNELLARITGYLGGRVSEEIFFDDISSGAQNDIEQATRIARMMVTELGMSELGPIQYESNTGSVFLGRDYASTQRNFSTEIAFEIDKAVRKIMENCHEKATKILTDKKKQVEAVANKLLEQETITAEEIEELLNPKTKKTKKVQEKAVSETIPEQE